MLFVELTWKLPVDSAIRAAMTVTAGPLMSAITVVGEAARWVCEPDTLRAVLDYVDPMIVVLAEAAGAGIVSTLVLTTVLTLVRRALAQAHDNAATAA